jgi:hypothetical protein
MYTYCNNYTVGLFGVDAMQDRRATIYAGRFTPPVGWLGFGPLSVPPVLAARAPGDDETAFVQGVDPGHLARGQGKVEDLGVLADALRMLRLGNDDQSVLQVPASPMPPSSFRPPASAADRDQ